MVRSFVVGLLLVWAAGLYGCAGAPASTEGTDAPGADLVALDGQGQVDQVTEPDVSHRAELLVDSETVPDQTEALFDPDRLVEVAIEMDPADWETLRREGRGLATLWSGCAEGLEYTWFEATVTIDGETLEQVGVRKKGYLGSLSLLRPSVKLNFQKFAEGQTYGGVKRMTLNNDRQDPSHTHQVMSYALFRAAGMPAPRANFAHVTVNGEDLGFYTHVEPIKKPFLARQFGDDGGNLYEGQLADFAPVLVDNFQRKTNEKELAEDGLGPDRSDLDRVVEALAVEDDQLMDSLAQVMDLDSFFRFWALEALAGHWDSYSGNRNNFYIYRDPTTDLFTFIPWGTDGAFHRGHAFLGPTPVSVYAWSVIAHRLYFTIKGRARYVEEATKLLDEVWYEEELLAEIDRIESLVSPDPAAVDAQREYVTTLREDFEAELAMGGAAWMYILYADPHECRPPLDISGSFQAVLNHNDNFVTSPDVSLELQTADGPVALDLLFNNAVPAGDDSGGNLRVSLYGEPATGNAYSVVLFIPEALVAPGDVPFHGLEVFGMVFEITKETGAFEMVGYVGNGEVHFESAGTAVGEEVSGSFSGLLSQ